MAPIHCKGKVHERLAGLETSDAFEAAQLLWQRVCHLESIQISQDSPLSVAASALIMFYGMSIPSTAQAWDVNVLALMLMQGVSSSFNFELASQHFLPLRS